MNKAILDRSSTVLRSDLGISTIEFGHSKRGVSIERREGRGWEGVTRVKVSDSIPEITSERWRKKPRRGWKEFQCLYERLRTSVCV